jgi:lysophospholipase L1-like esterase
MVTLTVGAADLNLSGVLAACTAGTQAQCQTAITNAFALLSASCGGGSEELLSRLTDLYAEVADAAPNALIVVTGYPLLFELVQGDPNLVLKTQINNATAALNCTIQKAVAAAQASGINIVYVDVTHAFDRHGIGSSEELFINPPGTGTNAFHPTPAGYVAYAAAISAVLPSSWGVKQEQVA